MGSHLCLVGFILCLSPMIVASGTSSLTVPWRNKEQHGNDIHRETAKEQCDPVSQSLS